jgi:hypothetical protein
MAVGQGADDAHAPALRLPMSIWLPMSDVATSVIADGSNVTTDNADDDTMAMDQGAQLLYDCGLGRN